MKEHATIEIKPAREYRVYRVLSLTSQHAQLPGRRSCSGRTHVMIHGFVQMVT